MGRMRMFQWIPSEMKIKGKLPDWRSAKSHLSFVGGWEVATKKEHLAILAQLDVPCPKLEENDEKVENEEKFWQKRREIMAEMRKITMKQVISVVNKHLSKSRNKCPWNMKNMLFRQLNFFL